MNLNISMKYFIQIKLNEFIITFIQYKNYSFNIQIQKVMKINF
jgi:hypothetical protein